VDASEKAGNINTTKLHFIGKTLMNWILGHPFFKQIAILISQDIWSAPQNL